MIKDDKLFGRGGADDGYAMFAALSALLALAEQKTPRARAVILIEACEESGSYDLPAYVDHLTPRIGEPSLVVCLDSGCGDYERLWLTTSLRGVSGGVLSIRVLDEGVHSGSASGIVPSSFRILRELLSRLEDENTGAIVPKDLYVEIPAQRVEQAKRAAQILGSHVYDEFPFAKGVAPVSRDLSELILNRTWRPQLAVTGMDGLPPPPNAGNVMLPDTIAKVSVRLPPTLPAAKVDPILKELFESVPPYGAQVSFKNETAMTGWDAPALAPWLGDGRRASLARDLRRRARLHGRRRQHSLHGDAGREIPQDAVRRHGRAGPAFQCPRPERIPAHPDGQARLGLRGDDHRGAFREGEALAFTSPLWGGRRNERSELFRVGV